MSKGQYLSNYQQGVVRRYYANIDTATLGRLSELVSDLAANEQPGKVAAMWSSVHTLLKKTPIDQMRVGKIIAERNVEALAKAIGELAAGQHVVKPRGLHGGGDSPSAGSTPPVPPTLAPVVQATVPSGPPASASPPTTQELKIAYNAFKRRLRLTKLDRESQISRRALTGGSKAHIAGIQPPGEFPKAVWDELVKQGKLKDTGGGFYLTTESV